MKNETYYWDVYFYLLRYGEIKSIYKLSEHYNKLENRGRYSEVVKDLLNESLIEKKDEVLVFNKK